MHKAALLVALAVGSVWAGAQTPMNKHKAVASKAAVKPKMSASEEATAAAQAEAIAAAAQQAAPAALVRVQVQSTSQPVQAPAPALAAAPSVSAAVAIQALPTVAAPAALPHALAHAPQDAVSAEELAIAQRVHQGHLTCELGASIRVEPDAAQPGYFHLQGKGFRYRMRPVVTSTGAIRLEDAKAGAVWLQLANKSMLMDQKKGRRVADECANSEQLAYAQSMKTNPPPKLFDTTGMGR